MDDPPRLPESDQASFGAAGALLIVQALLDLVVGYVAVFASSATAHETAAPVLLAVLVVAYAVVFVVSTGLAVRDQQTGRRSPTNWAVLGLLAAGGVTFVFFGVVSGLGPVPA